MFASDNLFEFDITQQTLEPNLVFKTIIFIPIIYGVWVQSGSAATF